MSQQQTSNGLLLGAIVGGAIGAISALLLAPKSGAKFREDLANTCQAISQKTKDIASNVGQSTKDFASTIKEEATEMVDHAKQSNQKVMDSLSTTKEDVKDELNTTGS
ncbi:YtxH domain-containing protein [Paenibacillus alkaliterrae]|uniref:YtxH domain-containing protein n=1 Tax=Paenibacillus alkaliterrae TaxID=320909 RepID=UPI001F2677AC|nr:YtxH domain-containing protein [Paenibacillus alkaliterrae]MCF2940877.1 YtxH domain-containing protein [Paenibacillus alkaliterrae]